MIRLGLFTIGFLLPIAFGTVHPSGRCPDGWTRCQSKCFVLIKDKQHWSEAQMSCEVLRGNLATISNAGEDRIIGNLLSSAFIGFFNVWIGLHDFVTEGHFVWIETNRAPNYTNWKHGEPNNHAGKEHCGSMTGIRQWNDAPCYYRRPFVCETRVASAGTLTSIMMK